MRQFTAISAFTVVLALALRQSSVAQQDSAPGDDEAQRAIAAALARATAHPADPQAALTAARQRLTAALDELDQLLSKSPKGERRQWLEVLGVETIRAELARSAVDTAALRGILHRYFQNSPGLELPAMVAVRRCLSDLMTAADYAQHPEPAAHYRQQLAELERSLEQLRSGHADDGLERAGPIVAWIAPLSDEGAALAAAVRRCYCQPNATAQVSERFINLMMAQTVAEQRFISDVILGSQTTGIANTQAQVSFRIVPDSERGTLDVCLEGATYCPANKAQRRRIEVYSSSQTSIRAHKQLQISELGLSLAPATAACATAVQISNVEGGSRIVERLATRRANQLLPEAEAAASRKAEAEASSKLDQEADKALSRINEFFCEQFRAPLIRRGALPAEFRFASDAGLLQLVVAQYNGEQLAAATQPPELPPGSDLGGCVHESLVNNACQSLLAGVTIQDDAWRELMNVLTGNSPRPLWVHDRAQRWSVTLDRERPVTVHFSQGRIRLVLRFQSVIRGNRASESPVEVAAEFLPRITPDGPAFERQGELQVRALSSPSQVDEALHAFLVRKFGAVFPADLQLSGLVPPAGASLGKLRELKLTELTSDRGWLSLGYRLGDEQLASRAAAAR